MFWYIYAPIAVVVIASQLLFLWQSWRNYRYALNKAARRHDELWQSVLLTVPCKGIDSFLAKNIASILMLEYRNFVLHFVVEDESDPAYELLCKLKQEYAGKTKAREVSILVAGKASGCSQKIHNLLHSCRQAPEDIDVFAFADSDACLKPTWLQHMVYPLRRFRHGASTGYRWFVPVRKNLASLALSAINAKIAQLLGNTQFNQLWGGSMAVRADTFRQIDIENVWRKAISDDLSLSYAVKQAKMKIMFAPGCMVASYERATWASLFEFARRQFVITRVTIPLTWWFGMFSICYSLAGLWGGLAVAVYAADAGINGSAWCAAMPALFAAGQIYRAVLRQKMIAKLLPEDGEAMKAAAMADIFGTFVWSWVLFVFILASAFGRSITWRGIRYKLVSPTETVIIGAGNK